MPIEERIPDMTDLELKNLQSNAARLSDAGSKKQQAEAARLLPIIDAAVGARAQARAAGLATRRAERRVAISAVRKTGR